IVDYGQLFRHGFVLFYNDKILARKRTKTNIISQHSDPICNEIDTRNHMIGF
ncbi:27489_t:CDS:2, partial [Racocetra persica]